MMQGKRARIIHKNTFLAMSWLGVVGLLGSWVAMFAQEMFAQESKTPAPGDITAIQHIVFIIKENRSFDHYFGAFQGANGASQGVTSIGQMIPLRRAPDLLPADIGHDWNSAWVVTDSGKMDYFDENDGGNVNGQYMAFTQMTQADIPNYWLYAQNFVLSDNTFSSIQSGSFANHLYTIAAGSGGVISSPYNAIQSDGWGCDSSPSVYVQVMDAEGDISDEFPCFDFQTLADNLNNAGLSWLSYAPPHGTTGYSRSTFDAINHIRNTSQWTQHVVSDTQFVIDAQNGNLPAVSWLVTGGLSEHPPFGTCVGENWSVNQINAVMQGADWSSTAIFIVWDDFGGFYDHATPPVIDRVGFGPRVPMLIISPYAKTGYVSHTMYEFSSVLKFIEERFGLPPLTSRDANANDIQDSFDFTQTARAPLVLQPRVCPIASTTNLLFGSQVTNTTSLAQVVTLTNGTATPLTVSNITATGDFSPSSKCTSSKIPVGGKCQINVYFTPTTTGTRTGTLTITDSDVTSPQTVSLTGTGSNVGLSVLYPGIKFLPQALGTTARSQSVTLTNYGSTPLTISGISTVGESGTYPQTNNCGSSLAAGANCTIRVGFSPIVSGTAPGTLMIADDDPASPQTIRLLGKGTAVGLTPFSLTFGSQGVGTTSAPQNVKLTNHGSAMLTFASITASGDFAETNTCLGGIAGGTSCTISVTFTPSTTGTRTGLITISDSDGESPQTIKLTGTGS
jgi:phospholipase C